MKCPSCGAQLGTVGRFCPKCGGKLEQLTIEQEIDNQATAELENNATAVLDDSFYAQPSVATSTVDRTEEEKSSSSFEYGDYSAETNDFYQSTHTNTGKKTLSTGAKIGTILLAVCMFITSIAALLIYDVRHTLNKDGIEKIIEDVDIIDVALDAEFVYGEDLDLFYEDMYEFFGLDVSDSSLDKFIDKSTVKTFFAQELSKFCDDAISGDDAEVVIAKNDIIKLLQKNNGLIKKEFGRELSYSDMDEITYWFIGEEREAVLITSDELEGEEPVVYTVVTMGLSYITMAVFIALTAVIIFFMLRIGLSSGVCGVGIVFTIIGAVMAIILPVFGKLVLDNTLLGALLGEFAMINIISSIIVLAVGVVMLVVRGIVLKIRRS